MKESKQSLVLNFSNQANTFNCKNSNLSQFNYFVILGLEYLNMDSIKEDTPISVIIDREGDLSINGFNDEFINDRSIYIYIQIRR